MSSSVRSRSKKAAVRDSKSLGMGRVRRFDRSRGPAPGGRKRLRRPRSAGLMRPWTLCRQPSPTNRLPTSSSRWPSASNHNTRTSIASTFFVCAATFVACSIYGWTTKRDLTSLGGFLFMGLIGIIIATVVNIFLRSSAMHMIIGYIGVLIFVGLTAYDTQKIKNMALSSPSGTKMPWYVSYCKM